jgi:hypothetical protein
MNTNYKTSIFLVDKNGVGKQIICFPKKLREEERISIKDSMRWPKKKKAFTSSLLEANNASAIFDGVALTTFGEDFGSVEMLRRACLKILGVEYVYPPVSELNKEE